MKYLTILAVIFTLAFATTAVHAENADQEIPYGKAEEIMQKLFHLKNDGKITQRTYEDAIRNVKDQAEDGQQPSSVLLEIYK